MDKLVIVTPGVLPVPDVCGGAIEKLVSIFIDENEVNPNFKICVLTCCNEKLNNISYKYTKLVQIKTSKSFDKFSQKINKFLNFIPKRVFKIYKNYFLSSFNKKAYKYIKNNDFDYVLVEGNYPILEKLKKLNNRLIYHNHWNDVNDSLSKVMSKYFNNLFKGLYSHISVSNFIFNNVNSVANISGQNYVVDNCVSEKWINSYSQNLVNEIRRKFAPNGELIILYSGRLSEEKGVYELVKAFNQANISNCKLLIIGGSNYSDNKATDYTKKIRLEANKNENISLLGYINHDEVVNYFAACDVGVVPSIISESFSISFYEFHAFNKKIIASDCECFEKFLNDKNVMLIKRDNLTNNLARTLSELSTYKHLNELSVKISYNDKDYFRNICRAIKRDE